MQLEIDRAEGELLKRILEERFSDLRMEIRDTEAAPYQERLHRERDLLTALIRRLGALFPAS